MATNTKLIAPDEVKTARPDWPFGEWWTRELIRKGKLGCVRLGRRVFLTNELIDAYIARHTSEPDKAA